MKTTSPEVSGPVFVGLDGKVRLTVSQVQELFENRMKNPNGPSIEDKGEWADILKDQEEERQRREITKATLLKAASTLDKLAETMGDRTVIGSEWGNLQAESEILRLAVTILERRSRDLAD